MKRLLYLFIVLALSHCGQGGNQHIEAFHKFVAGFVGNNNCAMRRVSTETTKAMVEQFWATPTAQNQPQVLQEIAKVVKEKSVIQDYVVILRDSLSFTRSQAWVWFKLRDETGDRSQELCISLVRENNRWLVDIPVMCN